MRTAVDFDRDLAAYLAAPTEPGWARLAHRIIPGTLRTVWQAWTRVDGSAPLRRPPGGRWSSWPDAFTLRRAIRAAHAGQVPCGLAALCAVRDPAVPRSNNNRRGDGT